MIWCWRFFRKTNYFFPITPMSLIWLNMDIFPWILVLAMFLSLQYVMMQNLLHFTFNFLLDIDYKTCWNVVGYFLPMLRIQTLALFLYWKVLFNGLLFVDWEIYEMLWCSHYYDPIPIGAPICGKSTKTSNISSLIKGWSERSIFNVIRVEVFVPIMSS